MYLTPPPRPARPEDRTRRRAAARGSSDGIPVDAGEISAEDATTADVGAGYVPAGDVSAGDVPGGDVAGGGAGSGEGEAPRAGESIPADWPGEWHRPPDTPEETADAARRRLTRLALAPGTGEDVAALTGSQPTRWRLDGRAALLILGALLVVSLVVNAWTLTTMRSARSSSVSEEAAASSVTAVPPEGGRGTDPAAEPDPTAGASADAKGAAAPDPQRGQGAQKASDPVVVYVSGAVNKPGVYKLGAGARVDDAVKAAGGMTPSAHSSSVNLAEVVEDGVHVHIPSDEDVAAGSGSGGASGSAIISGQSAGGNGAGAGDGGAGAAGSSTAAGAASSKININQADAATLEQLPGVGPKTAVDIVTYREEHGPFRSVDDLENVPGIGPSKLLKMRANATV